MTLQDYFISHMELQKQWAYDKNTESPENLKPHDHTKVWWRCERGHEWQADLNSRVYSGRGCPYCSNKAIAPGENDMATVAPEMAALWHPERNGDLTPADVLPGSRKYVWWLCERGHSWRAPISSIKAGCACPYCSGRSAIPGETDIATTHPHVLGLWSPKNKLLASEVTARSHKKAWWVCGQGHEWEAIIDSVVFEGYGCPYCAGKLAIPGQTDLATVRPDMLAQWDYERNRDIDPTQILPSTHEKAWWKCSLGHSWQAAVFSRTRENSAGCPYCTGRLAYPGFNDLATLKPKVAEQWYQPLNGALRPEDVTLGSNKKVWWQCKAGHVWRAVVYSRTRKKGAGCPVCAGTVRPPKASTAGARKKQAEPRVASDQRAASINA